MPKFTKTGINLMRLGIVTIVFILIQIFMYQYANKIETEVGNTQEIIKIENTENSEKQENTYEKIQKWQLEINVIGLNAEIEEGTNVEVLNRKIGHFEQTQKREGNIGLAAHNRGYEVNYFEKLKQLKKGDEIKYIYNDYENIYEVNKNIIIKDTDWEKLENTEENMLTLITCIENEPNYRRCVQAIEKEEKD